VPERAEKNAIERPSGEILPPASSPGLCVSRAGTPPSGATDHSSVSPPRSELKSSAEPSGAHEAWPSFAGSPVTRRGFVPSASIT